MSVANLIEQKLKTAFSPTHLEVRDDSHKHAGHVGAKPEGETHFFVEIDAPTLKSMTRVAAQRAVYQTLDAEMKGPVHALELKIRR
ncbi:MAG: BolA family protein [Alphaproteobacteria bacterium]